ncbi:alpha/beta hydrolase [Pedomonas mirosovicensis]|uniref:alpha/beta hydrolase n=1 Tax=Pedomonas mirosovicensis TaxID=2908641 RepID=UPI002166EE7E|nr:alpha/beta hydrolase [Pedomonas mirosovicensis]MCH8684097.1 alpha/beta hydrolase [Pedomonas mirosovicensis]
MAEKPLLYFIHGMWAQPRIWDAVRAHFEANGYQTRAPALPGHDISPSDPVPPALADLSVTDYVAALEADLREIEGPVVLIGHSLGGLIAQMLADRLSPAGLVLLAPGPSADILPLAWGPIRTCWPIMSRWGFWDEALPLPREVAFYGVFNGVPADVAELEYGQAVYESGKVLAEVAFGAVSLARRTKVNYDHIRCPSLVVVGTQDRITPASVGRATARRLPRPVQYCELDDTGHWLFHLPVRDKVTGLIDAFLASLQTA